jgi:hypothetical protein
VICVGVHPVTTPLMLPSINVPCVLPNPVPTIVTVAPTVAADGLTLVIVGTSTVNAPPAAITHPTSTRALPDVAPAPTFAVIEVSFQVCTAAAAEPSHTCPVPWAAPNPLPMIVTTVTPGSPWSGDRLVIAGPVTVNAGPLVLAPFCRTRTGPVVALHATVAVICVSLQLTTVPNVLPSHTLPAPCVAPKPDPLTVTVEFAAPDAGEMLVTTGGAATANPTVAVPPGVVTVRVPGPAEALPVIVSAAKSCAAFDTATVVTVIPGLLAVTVAPGTNPVPLSVTAMVLPCTPIAGAADVIAGAAMATVDETVPLVPPEVVTATVTGPSAALGETENIAVICVKLTTTTLLTAIWGLLAATVAPLTNPLPVSVTGVSELGTNVPGLIEVNTGTGGFTVNATVPLVPPEVLTATLAVPNAAPVPIVNGTVICVALTTVTVPTAISGLLTATVVASVTNPVPVSVTGTVVPRNPLPGARDVKVGAAGFTVNSAAALVPPLVVTVTFAAPRAALVLMLNVAVI